MKSYLSAPVIGTQNAGLKPAWIHSFNPSLLSMCCMPGAVLDPVDTAVSRASNVCSFTELKFQCVGGGRRRGDEW